MKNKYKTLFWAVALCIFILCIIVVNYIDRSSARNQVCTVVSSKLVGDTTSSAPTTSIEIETQECGSLGIAQVESPQQMNKAALNDFLNNHIGERFEFIVYGISLGNNAHGYGGITSTTPVE